MLPQVFIYTHKLNRCLQHFCNCAVETLLSKADYWHQPCVKATLQYLKWEGAFRCDYALKGFVRNRECQLSCIARLNCFLKQVPDA